MLLNLLTVSLLLGACAADYFSYTDLLVAQRLDPVMQPGVVSNHTHLLFGNNALSPTYDAKKWDKGTCSTVNFPGFMSSYWYPALHYRWPSGQFSLVKSTLKISYLKRNHADEPLIPTPNGLMLVAGNPFRRQLGNTPADRAVVFDCRDKLDHTNDPAWNLRNDFFPHACPSSLVAWIVFPACWNGKDLMKPDLSHVAYPLDDPIYGHCPSSHPHRFQTIHYEVSFATGDFNYRSGAFVFSFGDASGLGFHADVISHWDQNIMKAVINECSGSSSIETCPPLKARLDSTKAQACRPMGPILKEDHGRTGPIPRLLGDNPVWEGTGPKPSCNCAVPTPAFVSPNSTLASGYKTVGCVKAPVSGRLLTGAVTESITGMTGQTCTTFCASKGFKYAATEHAVECTCGNSFANGGNGALVNPNNCNGRCSGNPTENCGAASGGSLTLYQKTASKRDAAHERVVHD